MFQVLKFQAAEERKGRQGSASLFHESMREGAAQRRDVIQRSGR